ncbi:MAG: tRNA pseudouridine(55) synthase TruB [Treponema sp.]|nr:tRNA pseudouridine(55) synthase TruB [Treponema sp.]
MSENINSNKIILLAKRPAQTSFSSLFTVKHALNTQKVGHTGTLDSFACGLLVVCTGALTRLCGRITEFNKTYEAVITFGKETDTLECTGQTVKTASLPTLQSLKKSLLHFTGTYMQKPPVFSAIHINGKRASDMVRSGRSAEIPARAVTVFGSELLETKLVYSDGAEKVSAARIRFTVSKGTYIRSLARDIADYCGSAAFLTGLLRTKVGNFDLRDAAGFNLLDDFTIESACKNAEFTIRKENEVLEAKKKEKKSLFVVSKEELILRNEVVEKSLSMTKDIAVQCGFSVLEIKPDKLSMFRNGAKLRSDWFDVSPFSLKDDFAAVFAEGEEFCGLLEKDSSGYFKYSFVIN